MRRLTCIERSDRIDISPLVEDYDLLYVENIFVEMLELFEDQIIRLYDLSSVTMPRAFYYAGIPVPEEEERGGGGPVRRFRWVEIIRI